MVRTSYIFLDNDDVRFVLDQHSELDCYGASPLKQQHVVICRSIRAHYSDSESAELCAYRKGNKC